jgi:tRNA G18 (ribose-2'-O)-methylase SpoU
MCSILPRAVARVKRDHGPMPPRIEPVHDPTDERVAPYRSLRDPETRRRIEPAEGVAVVSGFVLDARLARVAALWPDGPPLYVAPAAVLDAVAGFSVHRGVLALARRPTAAGIHDVGGHLTVVALDDLNDVENLGAIGRAARALGAGALVLSPRCADPYTRRALRVSQGHLLHLPVARAAVWPDELDGLRSAGHRLVALSPDGDADLDGLVVGPADRLTLLLGAEGPGLSPAVLDLADLRIRIPLHPGVDSLNVGHAAAIALHHVAASRRAMMRG